MTVATTENVASSVAVDPGKVLSYLGLNPADPKAQAVVAVAQRYDLDPVLKHVIVIPKGGVYITRDGLLHVAHRSGQLDGIVVEQEPTLAEDGREWVARVSVYRKDMRHPFTFPGRYPVQGSNRDYAQEMALKAAEAHALRRAFDVTGLPALDEQRPAEQRPAGGLASVIQQTRTEEPAAEPEDPGITKAQLTKLHTVLTNLGMGDADKREEALSFYESVIGRPVESSKNLTKAEARDVIDALEAVEQQPFAEEPVDAEVVDES